jgi:molybdopterin/thiamine biosynthesis adenylyltransferase
VLKGFQGCDVIFSCTDDEWGRSLLSRLSIYYYIPVIDMGVKIDSKDGVVNSIQGRVTTLFPGSACLFCRGRITSAGVRAEMLADVSPDESERLRKEGYAPELGEPAPAVIAFTTAVAAGAVAELLHMLTGFMGTERASTEVIYRFDDCRVGTNSTKSKPDCFCSQRDNWGKGDQPNFLGLTWRKE